MKPFRAVLLALVVVAAVLAGDAASFASPEEDAKVVAELDNQYQAAVKRNDAAAMDRMLHEDFALVLGDGKVADRNRLLKMARTKEIIYERQEVEPGTQKVRVWGDTAVVTAKLWVKGKQGNASFDEKLWFSDTYVRTKTGWRYVFGQASTFLPAKK